MDLSIERVLQRYQPEISRAIAEAINTVSLANSQSSSEALTAFYGQMRYHLGWVDQYFHDMASNPGKLLRPTLLLLAYELCQMEGREEKERRYSEAEMVQKVLPAAVAVELAHNFTLIHDDIEDGDAERRHRATVWKLWGVPHGINTGDGMFALARLTLWGILREQREQIEPERALKLAEIFDQTILWLTEGQYLDICFEEVTEVTVPLYIEMIERKTAALIRCALEMGAWLGTRDEALVEKMREFGLALGIAFQIRDDLLGIWGTEEETGKRSAGDIYRRKKSLPIVHALAQATGMDRERLFEIYRQEIAVTPEQVQMVLGIMERTGTREYCARFLSEQCERARLILPEGVGKLANGARKELLTIVDFIELLAHGAPMQRV